MKCTATCFVLSFYNHNARFSHHFAVRLMCSYLRISTGLCVIFFVFFSEFLKGIQLCDELWMYVVRPVYIIFIYKIWLYRLFFLVLHTVCLTQVSQNSNACNSISEHCLVGKKIVFSSTVMLCAHILLFIHCHLLSITLVCLQGNYIGEFGKRYFCLSTKRYGWASFAAKFAETINSTCWSKYMMSAIIKIWSA